MRLLRYDTSRGILSIFHIFCSHHRIIYGFFSARDAIFIPTYNIIIISINRCGEYARRGRASSLWSRRVDAGATFAQCTLPTLAAHSPLYTLSLARERLCVCVCAYTYIALTLTLVYNEFACVCVCVSAGARLPTSGLPAAAAHRLYRRAADLKSKPRSFLLSRRLPIYIERERERESSDLRTHTHLRCMYLHNFTCVCVLGYILTFAPPFKSVKEREIKAQSCFSGEMLW